MHAESVANVQGLGSIPDARFIHKLGRLSTDKLEAVREAIRFALEL